MLSLAVQNNLYMKNPSKINAGTAADLKGGVDIGKMHRGYFSDQKHLNEFITIGLKPIIDHRLKKIKFADFGCGQGQLAFAIKNYLKTIIKNVEAIGIDANPIFLKTAKEQSITSVFGNVAEISLTNLNLATMRAVLHYNDAETQINIIKNIYHSLKNGGTFIHQVSAGTKENCSLRTNIVNLPYLGRGDQEKNYLWTSTEETLELHRTAGFNDTSVVGYASPCFWTIEEQWDRFNAKATEEAKINNNEIKIKSLSERKVIFIEQATLAIKTAIEKDGLEKTGVELLSDGTYRIHYVYPIILCSK